MRLAVICSAIALAASACATPAPPPAPEVQQPASTAVRDSLKSSFDMVRTNLTSAAEQVPENLYAFQPTPEVRTMGQLFAHAASASYTICGAVSGEATPEGNIEETRTTKEGIEQALTEAFEFCDRAFDTVDDTTGAEPVTLFGAIDTTRLGALAFNNMHNMEHYGNVVTYMRLNKMVPPSSQQ